MTSRCGGCLPLERRASRCSTPKRCCSSTTTSPRSWNCTLSSISACVPITIPASPVTRSSSACRRAAAPIEPVSSTTLVPCSAPPSMPPSASSPIISVIERWCCWASTSVGASIAACPPASTTASIARSATIVLPEPTSPWSRRCIGCSVARSSKISLVTFCWPSVRVKGSLASKASSRPSGAGPAGHGGQLGVGVPAAGEGDLEDEGLVPLQAVAGVRDVRLGVRAVDLQQGLGERDEAAALAQRRRQRVDGLPGAGQHRVDRLGDLPGLQLLAGRVDRDAAAPAKASTASVARRPRPAARTRGGRAGACG